MTDDERLGALFHAAASDSAAPEPGFDHETVVRRSRQITARRRTAVVVGGLALFAAVGVGGAIVLPWGPAGGGDATSAAAPMLAPEGPAEDAQAQRGARPPAAAEDAPGAAPEVLAAPRAAEGVRSPLGPGTAECADRQDPALRAVVEEFLPEAVGAPEAAVTEECRPGGERGVSVEITDGATAGLLTVQYLPPGTAPGPREGAVSAVTASGGTVVVSSRGDGPGAAAPFADRIHTLAAQLAPRL